VLFSGFIGFGLCVILVGCIVWVDGFVGLVVCGIDELVELLFYYDVVVLVVLFDDSMCGLVDVWFFVVLFDGVFVVNVV